MRIDNNVKHGKSHSIEKLPKLSYDSRPVFLNNQFFIIKWLQYFFGLVHTTVHLPINIMRYYGVSSLSKRVVIPFY